MSIPFETAAAQNDRNRLVRELNDTRKAFTALQQMVDALASQPALTLFVPAALRIVARAFETNDCAYYEHVENEPIRLRYWFFESRMFGPEDIQAFAHDHPYAGIKVLAAGFQIPDTYLGKPFRTRTKPLILNRGWDQFEGQWEQLRRQFNWYMVLNVPLIVDGEAVGSLVMNRGNADEYSSHEIDLAEKLGQQLALAMAIDHLTTKARHAARLQASELAAHMQLGELTKIDWALQQTTNALAVMPDQDNFIPAFLRIIATMFNSKDCLYYEHRLGDPVTLRYWLIDDRVLTANQIASLDSKDKLIPQISTNFTISETCIGVSFRKWIWPTVVDHTKRDPSSTFNIECNRRGWNLQLNVPIVVAGQADGTLLIYRGIDSPFTASEISLAVRLSQQLALAIEASRLSNAAKDAAIAQERERSSRQRGAELSRHADVLTQTIDSLVEEEDFLGFIGRLLVIASNQLGAPVTEYWANSGLDQTKLLVTCRSGIIYPGSDDVDDPRTRGFTIAADVEGIAPPPDRPKYMIIDMLNNAKFREHVAGFDMPIDEWCNQRGVRQLILVPLMRNDYATGALCIYLPADRALDEPQLDLAFSLGQQVSLAVRMTELAEQSKQSALSRERETAANRRAEELTKANTLLRSTLEQLSDERDLQYFPRAILRMAMEQADAQDGVIFVLDKQSDTLRVKDYLDTSASARLPNIGLAQPLPVYSAAIWSMAMAARSPVVFDTQRDAELLSPGAGEWHRHRGNRSVIIVPMFINMEPYGFFGLGLSQSADDVSKVDLEMVQALTQQASLAIQLARLVEESKQTAVAQEREKAADERAAEFANANEVLRSTLDQLSKEHELHSFPRTILQEAMKHTGARDGIILLFNKYTDTLDPSEYISADGLAASPELTRPFSASGTPAWSTLLSKRLPVVFDVEHDGPMLLPGLAAWHRRRGNRSIIAAAMFIDSQPYGYFGITLAERASDVSKVKSGLIHSLTQQATLAIQLTHLADASQQAAIMVERQQVIVQERANMAREIHDKLAQGYAAILMHQHTMRRSLLRDGAAANTATPLLAQLDIIERLSRDNLADARRTMDELRIDPFGTGDLAAALQHCISQLSREHDFVVSLQLEEDLPSVRRYVETELCRIVLEAVTNVRKHARCGSAVVRVNKEHGAVRIMIDDDGVGFDMQTIGPTFGLASMQERAARAGAMLQISSTPGYGTKVQVTLAP